jgi:hypothetical protein
MTHEIRRYNDEKMCSKCGCTWDVDEKAPEKCIPEMRTIVLNSIYGKFPEPDEGCSEIDKKQWEKLKNSLRDQNV